MAVGPLTLTVETEAVRDAMGELEAVMDRLARRHGERFRALDRRIEAFLDAPFEPAPTTMTSEDGQLLVVFAAPPALAEILRAARAMGV